MAGSTISSPVPEPIPARLTTQKVPARPTFWQRLWRFFRPWRQNSGVFQFDTDLVDALRALAERERRTEQEVAQELLALAIAQRDAAEAQLLRWRALTPREQQVVALVCLNYTNEQIANRLVISPETVKTHIRNVLWKLNLAGKADLRQALVDWDFSAYEEARL
jgi:DNA-binding CsgD family transcriptional regulator